MLDATITGSYDSYLRGAVGSRFMICMIEQLYYMVKAVDQSLHNYEYPACIFSLGFDSCMIDAVVYFVGRFRS